MIMTDIEAEHGRSAEDGNPNPAVPSSTDMIPDATNGQPDDIAHNQEPPELPIDRRRKVTDPSLFDLPVQEAPAKHGTSKGEYADCNALNKRILQTRLPAKLEKSKRCGSKS